jgi:cell division FtsZ-interacting protein ZapD
MYTYNCKIKAIVRQNDLFKQISENVPFQGYTRKSALFRATQIFEKVTKGVVKSQINVSFSPALI